MPYLEQGARIGAECWKQIVEGRMSLRLYTVAYYSLTIIFCFHHCNSGNDWLMIFYYRACMCTTAHLQKVASPSTCNPAEIESQVLTTSLTLCFEVLLLVALHHISIFILSGVKHTIKSPPSLSSRLIARPGWFTRPSVKQLDLTATTETIRRIRAKIVLYIFNCDLFSFLNAS